MSELALLTEYPVKDLLRLDPNETVEQHITVQPGLFKTLTTVELASPLEVTILFDRTTLGLLGRFSATAKVKLECSKCLTPIESTIEGALESEFVHDASPDEELYPIAKNQHIDISQCIIDTIVPAIPPFPLCRANCQGLCQVCGQNLNDHPNHLKEHPDHHSQKSNLANTPRIK